MVDLSPYLMLIIGLPLLLGGAELLVRFSVKLAGLFGRSRFLIGMTVLAFGTSAPEMAIGVFDVLGHDGRVGLGNVIGSNIFNVFFVLGLAALVRPIKVERAMFRRDVPILLGISILFYLLALNGAITVTEALVLAGGFVGYMVYLWKVSAERAEVLTTDLAQSTPTRMSAGEITRQAGFIVLAVAMLAVGAHFLVEGAIGIARARGVSELTIGLSIVAVGTSLPEIVTTLMAVVKREHSLAIGNVLGSCIFNLIAVPTIMVLVSLKPIVVTGDVLLFDLPVMILAVLACLPIFISGLRISRFEGALFLIFYSLYALMLYAKERPEKSPFEVTAVFGILAAAIAIVTIVAVALGLIKSGDRLLNKGEQK